MSDEPKHRREDKGLDESVAHELYLFIQNDADLYHQQYTPINKNLTIKKAQGRYDSAKAAKLFGYLVEIGAKKYNKEFGGGGSVWHDMFPVAVRKAVAEELRDYFETESGLGNYDQYIPKKYQEEMLTGVPEACTIGRVFHAAGFGGLAEARRQFLIWKADVGHGIGVDQTVHLSKLSEDEYAIVLCGPDNPKGKAKQKAVKYSVGGCGKRKGSKKSGADAGIGGVR